MFTKQELEMALKNYEMLAFDSKAQVVAAESKIEFCKARISELPAEEKPEDPKPEDKDAS